jgi:hypothetical protein
MKVNCSTSLEERDAERIRLVAEADMSSVATIFRKLVVRGLPELEREILGRVQVPAAAPSVPEVVPGLVKTPGGLMDIVVPNNDVGANGSGCSLPGCLRTCAETGDGKEVGA